MASSSFTLFGLSNTAGTCRLGITVTRKVGGAVRRNRIKRRFREIFRRNRTALAPDLDLVVNAHRTIDPDNDVRLEAEFLRAFGRLARNVESAEP